MNKINSEQKHRIERKQENNVKYLFYLTSCFCNSSADETEPRKSDRYWEGRYCYEEQNDSQPFGGSYDNDGTVPNEHGLCIGDEAGGSDRHSSNLGLGQHNSEKVRGKI